MSLTFTGGFRKTTITVHAQLNCTAIKLLRRRVLLYLQSYSIIYNLYSKVCIDFTISYLLHFTFSYFNIHHTFAAKAFESSQSRQCSTATTLGKGQHTYLNTNNPNQPGGSGWLGTRTDLQQRTYCAGPDRRLGPLTFVAKRMQHRTTTGLYYCTTYGKIM